jgi:hypothetical protein
VTVAAIDMEAGEKAALRTNVETDRPSMIRWIGQPLVCIIAVAASLIYVNVSNVDVTE